jgi:hypothetical protein
MGCKKKKHNHFVFAFIYKISDCDNFLSIFPLNIIDPNALVS